MKKEKSRRWDWKKTWSWESSQFTCNHIQSAAYNHFKMVTDSQHISHWVQVSLTSEWINSVLFSGSHPPFQFGTALSSDLYCQQCLFVTILKSFLSLHLPHHVHLQSIHVCIIDAILEGCLITHDFCKRLPVGSVPKRPLYRFWDKAIGSMVHFIILTM